MTAIARPLLDAGAVELGELQNAFRAGVRALDDDEKEQRMARRLRPNCPPSMRRPSPHPVRGAKSAPGVPGRNQLVEQPQG